MELRFDFEKSLQAAAYLLQLEEGRMPYLRLLTLMYIAERELLAADGHAVDWGHLQGDGARPCSQPRSRPHQGEGFKKRGMGGLHQAKRLCGQTCRGARQGQAFGGCDRQAGRGIGAVPERGHWELRDLTNEFPEWAKNLPAAGSALIPLKDILEAQGESQETLDLIKEGETVRQHMSKIFGARTPKKPPEPVESVQ